MYTSADGSADLRPSRATGWVGWIIFAALMMMVSGLFDIVWGIVGLARDEVFIAGPNRNVVDLDYTTWGWINLVFGIVVVAAGLALPTGALWAMITAVIMAVASAVANLLVIAAFPVWSVIVITLDVIVIYAITVHGRELRST